MRKIDEKFFYITFLILLLPSFNLSLLYTHALAKFFMIILLFKNLIFLPKKIFFNNKFIILFSFFFISQTLSIVSAESINDFINRFKDVLFIWLFLINTVFLFSNKQISKRNFLIILFTGGIFNIIVQLLIFLNPSLFLNIFDKLLHPSFISIIQMNIERDRIFFMSYEEILIPFFFYLLIEKKQKKIIKFIFFLLIFLIFSISFLSNFRSKFLMFLSAFFLSTFLYRRYIKKFLFLLIFILFFSIFMFSNYLLSSRLSIIDRFLMFDDYANIEPINYRINQIKEVFDIFISKPIFGIGLGNYLLYSNKTASNSLLYLKYKQIYQEAKNPHNIFLSLLSETGIFGLTTFLILLFYFVKLDISILKDKDLFKKSILISFWTLFFYSLFNPTLNLSYNIVFWFLRSILL